MIDVLKYSAVAESYYNRLKKKGLPSGWEKWVATNGDRCVFVKSDYKPLANEAVFYLQTRNFNTLCQLYKRGDEQQEQEK